MTRNWPAERLAYCPGSPLQTDVVLVRAICDLLQNDQLFVDYGDQSAKEFFGVDTILGVHESHPDDLPAETERDSKCRKSFRH